MKKYFKTNKDYFKFYNINKDKIMITGKYVIYRGDAVKCGEVEYLNVEEYLKSLVN